MAVDDEGRGSTLYAALQWGMQQAGFEGFAVGLVGAIRTYEALETLVA